MRILYFQYNDKQKKACYSIKVKKEADLRVQRKEDTQMTMTYFVWKNDYNVDDNMKALDFGQGLCFAHAFLTKRRKEKL